MSTFDGTDYFSSGPHHAAEGPRGGQWVRRTDLLLAQGGFAQLGPHQRVVTVQGVLSAATPAAAVGLLDALASRCGDKGDLADDLGRLWAGLTLIDVTPLGPPAVGRVATQAYRAVFMET